MSETIPDPRLELRIRNGELTSPQSIELLGQLLGQSILRSGGLNFRRVRPPAPAEPKNKTDELILFHLELSGATSPAALGHALQIPRATLTRRLARLTSRGLITFTGRTRGTLYERVGGRN